MNASGKAVADLCQHVSVSASDLIVIHDDLDFPLGRVKVKTRGGDAGHYGVRSIIDHLGTGEFCRVRVGIGRPATKDEVVDFVLSPFTPVEIPLAEDAIGNAVAVVENLLR
jgi:PTH1 family peptidyl-tRNA hydrolase